MAIGAGLNAVERDFSVMYPSSLFTKPLLCVQDYVQSLSNYATKGELCSPLQLALFVAATYAPRHFCAAVV